MAALLDTNTTTGRAALYLAETGAWHGEGEISPEALDWQGAYQRSGLDWIVEQWPLYGVQPGTTNVANIPNRMANVRSNTKAVLGVVGTGYKPFQNSEMFDFLEEVVRTGTVRYESAGSLKGGTKVWALARLPKEIQVTAQDRIVPYALICNGHDGETQIKVLGTTTRVVCNNTLTRAINHAGGSAMAIRHCQSMAGKVEAAREQLGLVAHSMDAFQEEAQALARHGLTSGEAQDYFQGIFPTKTQVVATLDDLVDSHVSRSSMVSEIMAEAAEREERQSKKNAAIVAQVMENFHDASNSLPGIAGSAWAAFNSVSEWADHQKPVRGKDAHAKADNRLNSVWFGAADQVKQQAYSAALNLIR